jgi:CBS domain-containing protein
MELREIMTQEVEVIGPDATLPEAAQQMRASNIGALPVCDGNRIVGILSERDLMGRAAAEGHEAMTPELPACFEDQEGADAVRLMQERQIRHLAVLTRDQHLVGIISLRDVAAAGHEGGSQAVPFAGPYSPVRRQDVGSRTARRSSAHPRAA